MLVIINSNTIYRFNNNRIMENKEIQKIANLAKLIIDKDKEGEFSSKLTSVINMIDVLKTIDCTNIKPLTSASGMNLRMRDDIVNDGNQVEEILYNVPGSKSSLAKQTHFFIVPKVIE